MKNYLLLALTVLICLFQINAQENVTFNTSNLASGTIERGVGSVNSCWLLDSDIERPRTNSMAQRIGEMKCGSLRFPYGHLADNYLWDTPPYGGTLTPKVATFSQAPGKWVWAVDTLDGTFIKDMDFDEYMSLCSSQGIEPLVVVNILSYKYNNGPTYDELKTSAVEWVKYAKNKGYDVAFWQIGNEIDHHADLMTKTEFINLYIDFVLAMKAEDSTIACGPGILSSTDYFNSLMSQASNLVDFTSCHQYLFGKPWNDYVSWRDSDQQDSDLTNNISKTQNAVNASSKPNLPILVTETNAYGNWSNASKTDLFKGLAWFDMAFTELKYEDVKYLYMWNSHSPWGGEYNEEAVANAWFNNDENKLTSMGWPLYIINNTVETKFMYPDNKINGYTNSYGSYNPSSGDMTIYLMNKDSNTVSMNVTINNYTADLNNYERWVWSGVDQYDTNSTYQQNGTVNFISNGFLTDLPPHSLVVIKLHAAPMPLSSKKYYLNHIGTTLHMKSNEQGSDVLAVESSDSSVLGTWKFEDAGSGYYYIVNASNNKKLEAISNVQDPGSIVLSESSNTGNSVKWEVTPTGSNCFIDNVAHNKRLNINGNYEVSFGSKSWIGSWVQWNFEETVAVTGLELTPDSIVLQIGNTDTLIANVFPSNATDKSIVWSSSDTTTVTVEQGIMTVLSSGTAIINATTVDGGYTESCFVQIDFVPVSGKKYYVDCPNHNLRLAATGESENPYTTTTSTIGDDVEWKFTAFNERYYIDRAAGGNKPRLRTQGITAADMDPTSSAGGWTQFVIEQASSGDYYLTAPDGPLGYRRLQINDMGNVRFVDTTNTWYWVQFKFTEVPVTKSKSALLSISSNSQAKIQDLTIYPNPAQNFTKIYYTIQGEYKVSIKIYDIQGKEVYAINEQSKESGSHSEILNLSGRPEGIYLIKLDAYSVEGNHAFSTTKKIMKK